MDDVRPTQVSPKPAEAKQDLLDLAGDPANAPVAKATNGATREPIQQKPQADRGEPANQPPQPIQPEVQSPPQEGEFLIPAPQLTIGSYVLRDDIDFSKGPAKILAHAAGNLASLTPIKVKKIGDVYHVVDGWLRVMAIRFQHGNTANVMVRAVPWDGSEKDALYHRFEAEFLQIGTRKIDKSCLLLQFRRT
jgi:hypothetical protein